MSDNLREFELSLKAFGNSVPETLGKFQRAVALEAVRGVVLMTPVDLGAARGAWTVLTSEDEAAAAATPLDKGGGTTLSRAAAVIAKVQPYTITAIVNRMPYIVELENGSSKQAPRGMMAVTLARLQSAFGP